ncbi:MAG: hypothetical protein WCO30_01550, partial [bacterium]
MIVGTIGGGALTGSPVGAIAGGVTGGIAGSKLCANETTRVNAEELRQYLNQAAAQVNGQGQQQGIFMGNTAEGYAVFAPLPQVQTPVANGGFGTRPTYCSPQVGGQGQVGVQPQPAYRPPVAVPQPSYGQPVYQQQPTMAQVQPPPQMAPGQQAPVVVN